MLLRDKEIIVGYVVLVTDYKERFTLIKNDQIFIMSSSKEGLEDEKKVRMLIPYLLQLWTDETLRKCDGFLILCMNH